MSDSRLFSIEDLENIMDRWPALAIEFHKEFDRRLRSARLPVPCTFMARPSSLLVDGWRLEGDFVTGVANDRDSGLEEFSIPTAVAFELMTVSDWIDGEINALLARRDKNRLVLEARQQEAEQRETERKRKELAALLEYFEQKGITP